MKINRLETHDRLQHFKEDQSINIFSGAEDCLKKNPLSLSLQDKSPYVYMFAHPRTEEDGVTKCMYWQPRLTKPKAQTNSYLFRAQSKTDNIEVCWLIPPRELWEQYQKGNLLENEVILWSIDQFENTRKKIQSPEKDDLPDEMICKIYSSMRGEKSKKKILNQYGNVLGQ